MKIERVELHHLSMPLVAPFETSFGVETDRQAIVLHIWSEGAEGWGECVAGGWPGYSYETAQTAWHVLTDYFVPAILGVELDGIEDYRRLVRPYKGHPLAKAGLELALWDLRGQQESRPLKGLLGGERDRVSVGVSVGIQSNPDKLVDVVRAFLAQGYSRIKIKIKPGRDVADTEAVRKAFPEIALQVDANSAYTIEDTPVFEALDSLNLLLIEQPFAEDDLYDHSQLQARLSTAICLDESVLSARHARQAIDMGACRIINIKPARVGGLAEALAVHDLCWAQDIPVWCGGMLETGIGRAANLALASLPGFTLPGDISATDRYYAEDIAEPKFILVDGMLQVPDAPGLGVHVLPDRVSRFTLRSEVVESAA